MDPEKSLYYINSLTPIRICDLGGWTDTWFAEFGQVLHIAVSPYVQVQLSVYPRQARAVQIEVYAENFAQRFNVHPGATPAECRQAPHPLLQATIACLGVPEHLAVQIRIYSATPSGASTGTSAAVTVALAAALDRLRGGHLGPYELARLAQEVETEWLGQQCGIQDQLCSAFGGIQLVTMQHYPQASVAPVELAEELALELGQSLALIYLGATHASSTVHEMVISNLEQAGPHALQLQCLRAVVPRAREALLRGDLAAFGQMMVENNEAQRALHPTLISSAAQQVIDIASSYGAYGWKVNGAGGEGGSLTILSGPSRERRSAMLTAIRAENPAFCEIPVRISPHGVRVWTTR